MCPKAAEWESGAYLAKPACWMYDKTEQTSITGQSLTELRTEVEKHSNLADHNDVQRKRKENGTKKARQIYLSVARSGDRNRETLTYAQTRS